MKRLLLITPLLVGCGREPTAPPLCTPQSPTYVQTDTVWFPDYPRKIAVIIHNCMRRK